MKRLLGTPGVAAAGLFAMALAMRAAACPPRYSVQIMYGPDCGSLGNAAGRALNSSGVTCGRYSCPGGFEHPFICYDGTTLTPISLLPGSYDAQATAINDAGVVTGTFFNDSLGDFGLLGFVRDGNALTTIFPLPGGDWVEAYGINSSKVVVGGWGNAGTGPLPLAYRWQDGVMQNLGDDFPLKGMSMARAINESGQITGYMGETAYPPNYHAFIWTDGKAIDLGLPFPECYATDGYDINDKGQVCGQWERPHDSVPFFSRRGFFYDGKQMIDLDPAENWTNVYAYGINNHGQIVGTATLEGVATTAFLWEQGVIHDLNQLIQTNANLRIWSVYSINDSGQMTGYASQYFSLAGGGVSQVAVLLTPIPPLVGDATCDDQVNIDDILAVVNGWGPCPNKAPCSPDLNDDLSVNVLDLITVIEHWQ